MMTEDDKELMEFYGIVAETKVFYLYGKYRYDNLYDAVKYAKAILKNDRLNQTFNDNASV